MGSLYVHTHTEIGSGNSFGIPQISHQNKFQVGQDLHVKKKNENLKVQDEHTGALFSNLEVGKALVNVT